MSRRDVRCERVCREVAGNIEEDAIECSLYRLLSRRDLFVLFVAMGLLEACDSFKWFIILCWIKADGNYIRKRQLFASNTVKDKKLEVRS